MMLIFPALLFSLSLSGCVYLVIGGVGAVGGYVVSPDTVEGNTEMDAGSVWEGAIEIASIMGTILESNQESGIIIAKISGAKVTITLEEGEPSGTKIRVKSRKTFFPKISVAQEVFVKIMSYAQGK